MQIARATDEQKQQVHDSCVRAQDATGVCHADVARDPCLASIGIFNYGAACHMESTFTKASAEYFLGPNLVNVPLVMRWWAQDKVRHAGSAPHAWAAGGETHEEELDRRMAMVYGVNPFVCYYLPGVYAMWTGDLDTANELHTHQMHKLAVWLALPCDPLV